MAETGDHLQRLVAAAQEGDDVAVRELVRFTQPVIWRLCNLLGTPGEEDDLVQDTYLRALRSLSTYRGEGSVIGWLSAIARRVCADHIRLRVRQRRLIHVLTPVAEDYVVDPPGNPTRELLDELDPDRREAFVLTQVAGLSYEEAALVLNCPIGTIRSRVARARAELVVEVRSAEAC
ncbi:MAG TPA: sigma factor-like helix-turn-helix DNA-binding protein [Ilumatobacteraceae bacterium]